MKEYNRATDEIHAPKDLIEKTKAAVQKEELCLKEKKKKTVALQRGGVVLAAALAIMILAVPALRVGMSMGEENEWQEESNEKVMLGQDKDMPGKLDKDRTDIKVIEKVSENEKKVPDQMVELAGITVKVYADESGAVTAEFEVDGTCYYAVQKTGDMEKLLKDIENYIMELSEQ